MNYSDMLRDPHANDGDLTAVARKCIQNRNQESYAACLASIDESFPAPALGSVQRQVYAANAQYVIFRQFPNLDFLRKGHRRDAR